MKTPVPISECPSEISDRTAYVQHRLAVKRRSSDRPDVAAIADYLASLYPGRIVRDASSRRFSFKTHDLGRIHHAIGTYTYGRYSVPRHVESVWADGASLPMWRPKADDYGPPGSRRSLIQRRRDWYVCAAGGGSLWKEQTHRFMSKKETHVFLTLGVPLSFDEAIVVALARSHTPDLGACIQLAKSKLGSRPLIVDARTRRIAQMRAAFWKDAIRFFCANPMPLAEVDDIVDYMTVAQEANAAYSLRGRTVRSLTMAMQQWHRDLSRVVRMGDHTWAGMTLDNRVYLRVLGVKGRVDWSFTELTTSKALAEEGNAMHHCVYSYQDRCLRGRSSIWSLGCRASGSGAMFKRRITFEIDPIRRAIVQVRGYANRSPDGEESAILRQWAAESGIV